MRQYNGFETELITCNENKFDRAQHGITVQLGMMVIAAEQLLVKGCATDRILQCFIEMESRTCRTCRSRKMNTLTRGVANRRVDRRSMEVRRDKPGKLDN